MAPRGLEDTRPSSSATLFGIPIQTATTTKDEIAVAAQIQAKTLSHLR